MGRVGKVTEMSESTEKQETQEQHHWVDGKWSCSTDEEVWDCYEQFDTAEQARQYAIDAHCDEQGQEFDTPFYVGRISTVKSAALAHGGVDATRILERMDEWLYDNVGEAAEDTGISATPAQIEQLQQLLEQVTTAWLETNKVAPTVCSFESVHEHRYERCTYSNGLGPDGGWQCTLGLGHSGDHETER